MEKISRKYALDSGIKYYFTGNPCKYGHISKRRASNCSCIECERERNKSASEYKRDWYIRNAKITKERSAKRYAKNREALNEYAKRYSKDNIQKIIARRKKRAEKDPVFATKERVRGLIKQCIRSKTGSNKTCTTSEILGCTVLEFKIHLERQFTAGMGWHNMADWHIDHIVPVSSASTPEEVIALNHFTNLRPMWASDNLKKSNKMEYII